MSQTACSEWTVSAGQADWGSAESEGTLARVQCSNGDDGKRSHDDEEKAGSVDANALIIPLVCKCNVSLLVQILWDILQVVRSWSEGGHVQTLHSPITNQYQQQAVWVSVGREASGCTAFRILMHASRCTHMHETSESSKGTSNMRPADYLAACWCGRSGCRGHRYISAVCRSSIILSTPVQA
jgi:hypothetical protein